MMSILAIVLSGCLVAFSECTGHVDVFVAVSILISSSAFLFDIQRYSTMKKYIWPISLGYLFRIGLLFYDVYTNNPFRLPLVGGALASDPLRFFNAAVGYSQGISTNYGGFFPKFLGSIFSITAVSRLWGEFIVLCFSLLTILVFVSTVDKLDIPFSYRMSGAYLICLLPNYALLSAVLRRETIITFFIALSIRSFINWVRGQGGNRTFLMAFVFALGASLFHGATGLLAVSYILVRIIYDPEKKRYSLEAKNIVGAVLFFLIFMLVYTRFGTVFFSKIEGRLNASNLASTRDAGGSSYARYVGDAKTPLRMILYALPRFLYFMFSPFPWQWRGLSDIVTFLLSSCVYLYIILNSVRYVRLSNKNDENRNIILALLVVALMSAAVFSWGVTNTGTATRHRDKFLPIYAVMFALSQKTKFRINLRKG